MYKVIFDTNSIHNPESPSNFFGGREELERFLKVAEIIIPDMVIEEIRNQKRKHLISKRDAFLSNPFHSLKNLDKNETKNFDINNCILQLEADEKLPFSTIGLTRSNAIEEIKKLCLANDPPFDGKSDKGFKDAYIYLSILEYLENCSDKEVFFVTNDNRLKEAFAENPIIKIVKDFSDFENYIVDYFSENYFIEKLKEELSEDVDSDSIEDVWLNIDENWVLKIKCTDKICFVEVDFFSKEIIGYSDVDFSDNIRQLVCSEAFQTTHSCIEEIKDYANYFSDDEIATLLTAAAENPQIYRISDDDDVKEFFVNIFDAKSQLVPDVKDKFRKYYLKT